MSKIFVVTFLIFGTVVGSGFSSGKEIFVFFSRFGMMSYFYIALAGIMFFWLFYFFLSRGKNLVQMLEKSRFLNMIVVFVSLVFCSSMFAGTKNLFSYFPNFLYVFLICVLLICCILLTIKGIRGLEKLNIFLMPAVSVLFLIVLVFCAQQPSGNFVFSSGWGGMLYCPLYVALNTSMSGLVISKSGSGLTKKQTVCVCLFSTLLLLEFLFLGNFVLLSCGESFFSEMPFLFLASKNPAAFVTMFVVILSGCFTTLISLCFTLKSAFDKIVKNEFFSAVFSVFLPFAISSLGFSQIVSFLYPICSVLGIFVLGTLLLGEVGKWS